MPRLQEAQETRCHTLAYSAFTIALFPSTSNSPGYGESSFRIKGFTSYIHTNGPTSFTCQTQSLRWTRACIGTIFETIEQNVLSLLTAHRSDYWPFTLSQQQPARWRGIGSRAACSDSGSESADCDLSFPLFYNVETSFRVSQLE